MRHVLIPRQMLMEHQNMPCWLLMLNFNVMISAMTPKLSEKLKFAKHGNSLITYVEFHGQNLFLHME